MPRWPLCFLLLVVPLLSMAVVQSQEQVEYTELVKQAETQAQKGNYAEATVLAEKALKIQEALGPDRAETADALLNLAGYYHLLRKSADAEPLLKRALSINEKTLGPEHEKCGRALNQLGLVNSSLGKYVTAGDFYKRAIANQEKALGKEHPRLGTTLTNYGQMYLTTGFYAQAEALLLRAVAIFDKAPASSQFNKALALNNLAGLYSRTGKGEKALDTLDKAKPILEKNLPPDHPMLATLLTNRGGLLLMLGEIPAGEKDLIKGQEIRQKTLPAGHPDRGNSLANLGKAALAKNDIQLAETHLKAALDIYEKAYSPDHPVPQLVKNNLALTWLKQGQLAKAEKQLLELVDSQEKRYGGDFPDLALVRKNLGHLYYLQGKKTEALRWHQIAVEQVLRELQRAAPVQNQLEQMELAALNRYFLNMLLSLETTPEQASSLYEKVLSWKGMVFYRRKLQLALAGDESLRTRLLQATRNFNMIYLQTPSAALLESHAKRFRQALQNLEALEKEMSARLSEATPSAAMLTAIQQLLPLDTAAIDILRYSHVHLDQEGKSLVSSAAYAAFILRKDKPILRVNLEGAREIDELVIAWRGGLDKRRLPAEGPSDPAVLLREKVWRPLVKELQGVKTVLISPDGPLATLPFAALPGEAPGKYLLEEIRIGVVPFLQAMPGMLNQQVSKNDGLLVVGDVLFGNPQAEAGPTPRGNGSSGRWKPLPGTREEADAIEALFKTRFQNVPLMKLLGAEASEERFFQTASQGRYIHLATHGFFRFGKVPVYHCQGPSGSAAGGSGDWFKVWIPGFSAVWSWPGPTIRWRASRIAAL